MPSRSTVAAAGGTFPAETTDRRITLKANHILIRDTITNTKQLKYVSFFDLIAPANDPGMSLEGIEFTEYPKESALLKKTIAETHRLNPGLPASDTLVVPLKLDGATLVRISRT